MPGSASLIRFSWCLMADLPQESWRVGSRSITPLPVDELDPDPRGVLWIYEPPRPTATYIVSTDPTVGKTGWNRWARTDDDMRIDNAVVEVLRLGRRIGGEQQPDVQVAEYAAPIDAVDLAPVVNAIGRMYAGDAEDGQALLIGEVTGPGAVTLRELIDRYGYTNHWMWTRWGDMKTTRTTAPWWRSFRSANKDLWMRGLHHIHKGRVILRSAHLIEEMSDCVADNITLIGEARHGRHDDRVMALLFALWAAHDWSLSDEPYEDATAATRQDKPTNYQATDHTIEEATSDWDEQMSRMWDR